MSAFLVLIACGYNSGCGDTASAYYLTEPYAQNSLAYTKDIVTKKFGSKAFLIIGSSLNAISGREFTVAITPHLALKSKIKESVSLSYTWAL